jgi:hypothetical protein
LPVFSPFIGIFGYAKQIAKIANQLTALAFLAMVKQIANIANGLSAVWSAHPDRPRPGTRCQAWIVMPIRSVIVLFARSLFAVGFLLAKPPPGPTAWPVRAGGSTRNFFIFNSLIASLYTKVLECLTLAL